MIRIIRFSIAGVSLLTSVIMGMQMLKLDFWAYRPLYFFLGLYLGIAALCAPWFSKHKHNYKFLIYASVSGLLLFLGFPNMPFTPLMFIAFLPLLYIEESLSREKGTQKWALFKYTFHTFLIWNILSTFWVANTAFVPSIFAFTLNAAFMCIPFVLFHQIGKKMGKHLKMGAWVILWLGFEWSHLRWEISWPWLTLGNSFAQYPIMIQWYEFTGYLGGSLWILLSNVLFFQFFNKVLNREQLHPVSLLKPFGLIMGMILISIYMYSTHQEQGETRKFAVVQPNYEPHFEKFTVPESVQVDRFIELSKRALSDSLDYLVFPETVFDCANVDALNATMPIDRMRQEVLDSFPDLQWISGLCTFYFFDEDEVLTAAARKRRSRKGGKERYYEVQNAAAAFNADKQSYPVHIKSRLVPGAEILPYKNLLFFLEPIVEMAGGSFHGLARRSERTVFEHKGKKIAPVICYESIYGEYVGQYVRKGANAIVIMTNDGWWDNTPGHIQHMKFASLRAIEHRRAIARSANTGVSCFIDQRGTIHKRTEYGKAAVRTAYLQMNDKITFYTKWGDYIGRFSAFMALLLLLALFTVRFRKH